MKGFSISKSEIIADLRRVAQLLNHSPSSVEYKKLGGYHVRTIQRKYQLPWCRIINSAGLRYTHRTSRKIPSTEELKRALLRIAQRLDRPPTRAEYQELGNFGPDTVRRRSRQKNWAEAASVIAGFEVEDVKRSQQ